MTFLRKISVATLSLGLAFGAYAAGGAKHAHPPETGWSFDGAFGEFDKDAMQRGYQVYREVCSACHSMKLLSYRNLGEKGGPFYDPDYPANENPLVKAFAAEDEVYKGLDDAGDEIYGPASPADTFRSPYANDNAARAANAGALPPDLSVITKARHGGASYIYSLMIGYPEAIFDGELVFPDEMIAARESHGGGHHGDEFGSDLHGTLTQPAGQYYNPYFPGDTTAQWDGDPRHIPPGGFLAMAPQLVAGRVEYIDGTEATVEQMASDVATFLAWAGEPKQVNRKSAGLKVIAFLAILALLLWFSFHQIWRDVEH
jgi:ubiquinol-cytochrome c reductase cytochrome c1 subunit